MLELLRDFTLKALGHLLPFAVAWFYKPAKIASELKFRIQSAGDGINFNLGELPTVDIWMEITNLSPFDVELDRMHIQVAYGGVFAEIISIQKTKLKSRSDSLIHLQTYLNDLQRQYVNRNRANGARVALYISAYFNSKLHSFETTRNIEIQNARLLNGAA